MKRGKKRTKNPGVHAVREESRKASRGVGVPKREWGWKIGEAMYYGGEGSLRRAKNVVTSQGSALVQYIHSRRRVQTRDGDPCNV